MDTLITEVIGWLPALLKTVFAAVIIGTAIHFFTKYSSKFAIWGYWTNIIAASIIATALFCVSAIFNMAYTEAYFQDSPLIGDNLDMMVLAMGAVNLVAGLALKVFGSAYIKKSYGTATVMMVPYLAVLCYSLVAASSMLDNGLANTDHKIATNSLETSVNERKAQELRAQARSAATLGNPNAAALGAQKMTNSNGVAVSVSGYCKAGNWYHTNRAVCRNYIDAQRNAGAQLRATNLLSQASELDAATVAIMKSTPVRLESKFFGIKIGDEAGSMLLALVVEMAAAVAVLFPFFIGPPPLPVSGSRSGLNQTRPASGSGSVSQTGSSPVSRSAGSAPKKQSSTQKPEKEQDHAPVPRLNDVQSAYQTAFHGVEASDKVTNDHLSELIGNIGLANPHAPAVANDIIEIIKHYRGEGVGKKRVLDLIQSPEMRDVILVENNGATNSYIYRDRTYAKTKPETAGGFGGLPPSASMAR